MSRITFNIKKEKHEAMIDLLMSEERGSLTDGLLLALEQLFSPKNIIENSNEMYENIFDAELLNRLKNGEDIVALALEFSEAKRVLDFREKRKKKREEKKMHLIEKKGKEKKINPVVENTQVTEEDESLLGEMFGDED
ncbi:MAG TPA: hypothetical protein EYP89_00740 [Candidatus Omnitrophica bacterium]|nr:hypothetical protein [Candidatus Omnitrophota bacterium]